METKVLISSQGEVYDVTALLEGEVILEETVFGVAGRLSFSLLRDGLASFLEGDKVVFYVDHKIRFVGFVMKKKRQEKQIISVIAYNQLFYLAKNKDTYIYSNLKASQVLKKIAKDYGLVTGEIQDTGWVVPRRIEEGQTLIDIIMTALELTKEANGKEFFLLDREGKLTLLEKDKLISPYFLTTRGEISGYQYTTDISKGTYNMVKLFQAGRKENQTLAYQEKDAATIGKWGQLSFYQKVDHRLLQGQLSEIAKNILKEKNKVEKKLVVATINSDVVFYPGQTVMVEITDLAETGVMGKTVIETCTYRFSNGKVESRLQMRIG